MAKAKKNAMSEIIKRYGITAREARDIATAVGTLGQAVRKSAQENISPKSAAKNVIKQVKETGRAAATGKRGTTSQQVKSTGESKQVGPFKNYAMYEQKKGTKRK